MLEVASSAIPSESKPNKYQEQVNSIQYFSKHNQSVAQPSGPVEDLFAYLEVSLSILPQNIGVTRPAIDLAESAEKCQNKTSIAQSQLNFTSDNMVISLSVSMEHIHNRTLWLCLHAKFVSVEDEKVSTSRRLHSEEILARPTTENMGSFYHIEENVNNAYDDIVHIDHSETNSKSLNINMRGEIVNSKYLPQYDLYILC